MPPEESNFTEIGYIVSCFSGVAKVHGLTHVFLHEVLLDEAGKETGIVIGFDEKNVEVLLFDDDILLENPLYRSHRRFSIPISDGIVGRVIDGLGQPLDEETVLSGDKIPVFTTAPGIIDRQEVHEPITTGIKIIDATLPLGKGQRELIIGDRNLGKSTIALDTVLNQKNADPAVYCIYVLCGKKTRYMNHLVSTLKEYGAFLYTTVVAATSNSAFAEKYLSPFVGVTIGEYFRDRGKHALVVYDDLSEHAKCYRDVSLLLERAPGREAYPGDVFSLHASLLERAAKLSDEKGGGSLTALPIVETQEGDVTSFIPTNIISITDGQIYLERGLYQKGFIPAINVGLSVSRVGGKAQPPLLRQVTAGLRLVLSQQNELQKLTQLETVVSQESKKKIYRGELTLELLKQEKHQNVSWKEQVVLFYAVEEGMLDDLKAEQWVRFKGELLEILRNKYPHILEKIGSGVFDDGVKSQIKDIIEDFKKEILLKE